MVQGHVSTGPSPKFGAILRRMDLSEVHCFATSCFVSTLEFIFKYLKKLMLMLVGSFAPLLVLYNV